jgi:UDP-N-acetylmuramate: L-alanyl-gamma-D-glutamyl-meso-diaminopimelate ligase
VIQNAGCRVYTYGKKGTDDWRIGEIAANPLRMRFVAYRDSREYESFEIPMTGEHNLLNALAAIAVAVALGIEKKQIREALSGFQGIRRRQEIRGVKNDIIVMDDFAHHPTAVRETISGVRDAWPERRLVAVFEPRTNTSMRAVFQQDYAKVFDRADLICIREASRLDKIPETERFSSRCLVSDIESRGKTAFYFTHTDDLLEFLLSKSRPGDVVLIMSNGGFDNLHQRLLEAL